MNKPFAATALSTLGLALAAIVVSGCSADTRVSKTIGKLIDEGGANSIRLADATSFDWDQVYLFGPYAARRDICATLRIGERECERQVPFESQDDDEMSIAFLAKGRLVHYVRHSRANGDFTPVPAQQPISRDRAVFRKPRGGEAEAGLARGKLVLE
ncbi:hypothetical protein [Telluria beijingensis]|uniref:hypothetical protein n=1 Tax=Telluria beijingensis TaxID=3068633 RepID=UPI002795E564|nr:hypothetical protein [Massilia sp. REN29]